jgi:hypothetical protein
MTHDFLLGAVTGALLVLAWWLTERDYRSVRP